MGSVPSVAWGKDDGYSNILVIHHPKFMPFSTAGDAQHIGSLDIFPSCFGLGVIH